MGGLALRAGVLGVSQKYQLERYSVHEAQNNYTGQRSMRYRMEGIMAGYLEANTVPASLTWSVYFCLSSTSSSSSLPFSSPRATSSYWKYSADAANWRHTLSRHGQSRRRCLSSSSESISTFQQLNAGESRHHYVLVKATRTT